METTPGGCGSDLLAIQGICKKTQNREVYVIFQRVDLDPGSRNAFFAYQPNLRPAIHFRTGLRPAQGRPLADMLCMIWGLDGESVRVLSFPRRLRVELLGVLPISRSHAWVGIKFSPVFSTSSGVDSSLLKFSRPRSGFAVRFFEYRPRSCSQSSEPMPALCDLSILA